MGFQRSAYTKYLVLGAAADHKFQPHPFSFPNIASPTAAPWPLATFNTNPQFANYDMGWNMGRRVNLFLETPNWEFSAYKVTVRAFNASSDPTATIRPVLVAPNAVLNDPTEEAGNGAIPYYTFLMGNPVYPNGAIWNSNTSQKVVSVFDNFNGVDVYPVRFEDIGGMYLSESLSPFSPFTPMVGCTAAGEVRLNYSAALTNVVGVGSRATASSNNLVKPTDTIELIAAGAQYSNLAESNRLPNYSSNNYPIITACRVTAQGSWRLEFAAMIDNYGPPERPDLPAYTGSGTYTNPVELGQSNPTAYTANEIYFVYATKDGSEVIGLAKNNMTVAVRGRDLAGNTVFTGRLYNACNLTHCRNNSQQIIDTFKDPGKYLNFSVADFAKTARPIMPANSIATNATNTYTFTYGNSQNGTQPIKTLAICDSDTSGSGQTLVAVTVEPAE